MNLPNFSIQPRYIVIGLILFVIVAVLPVSAYYYAVSPTISQGATVYIGEQGLNITPALEQAQAQAGIGSTTIGWWASAAVITSVAPTKSIDISPSAGNFLVSSADFGGYAGTWFLVSSTGRAATYNGNPVIVFTVADPTLDIRIWDADMNFDVTGSSTTQGENLTFRIDTNQFRALDPITRSPVYNAIGNSQSALIPFNTGDGYMDIRVKNETGATLSSLVNAAGASTPLTAQNVSSSGWFWASPAPFSVPGDVNWGTGARYTDGSFIYPAGTYTVWAESLLNNMKANYRNAGADYTGKTVSQTYTITVVADIVKIEANKDSVVRSKPFAVTISGRPLQVYHLWVKGTNSMKGTYNDQPPFIAPNQAGLAFGSDPGLSGEAPVFPDPGGYLFQNGNGKAIYQDVAPGWPASTSVTLANGSFEYANVTLSTSGIRTIELLTTNWTRPQSYTIRVEQVFPVSGSAAGGTIKSDEVDVQVEYGAVTIVAAGDQDYNLGENIKFSGTNSGTQITYLFLTGPGLPPNGAQIRSLDPAHSPVVDNDGSTFAVADVLGDNTWSWNWNTTGTRLDTGTYTIWAVDQPRDRIPAHLANVEYSTVNITIRKGAPATGFVVSSASVAPPGTVTSGTPVTASLMVDAAGQFPADNDLVFFTNLDKPRWTYTIYVNGISNIRPLQNGSTLDINGFELNYKASDKVSVGVTLQGTAPVVSSTQDRIIYQITQIGNRGLPAKQVTDRVMVTPSGGITVSPAPSANFIAVPLTGPAPLTVMFTDLSYRAATWNWSFGDGTWFNTTNAFRKNTVHVYSTAGTYTARLTVCNTGGCATAAGKTITVRVPVPPIRRFPTYRP
ncbi:MAG TPA: DUF3821 domain-containing protein [Methanoregula sp.]|nr:DUF3821 domain-containing protein [Methanoregula sp.]